MERRSFDLRAAREEKTLSGHAAVFNQRADLGWFREEIAPGAFADSIANDDIRALWNHNSNFVLGRNKAKTLELSEDATGLAVKIYPPDTQPGRDALVSIERGDVSQMSFGFDVIEQKWTVLDDKTELRTILKAKIYEVSPVTFPAYTGTDISARSAREIYEARPKTTSPLVDAVAGISRGRELDLIQQEAF
jgi:uncharacterized protein